MKFGSRLLAVTAILIGLALPAQADPINLNPSTTGCPSNPACLLETSETFSDWEVITGTDFVWKQNYGGDEEGDAKDSYEAINWVYDDGEPVGVTIDYIGGDYIAGAPIYLVVKDGNAHIPSWYLFELTGWDGKADIVLSGFWAPPNAQGAISNVAIYGATGSVPDGGSMAMLLGMALMGLAGVRRMLN